MRRNKTVLQYGASCALAAAITLGFGGTCAADEALAVVDRSGSADASQSGSQALTPEALEELEASGAVIGNVLIHPRSIFNLDDPEEDKLLYRFANKTHIKTRPQVIEQQLLFAPGEPLSVQRLEESERILRGNRYIQAARVKAVEEGDGVVDIEVSTTDTWTLLPKMSFSHAGGANKSNIGIREGNLLGTGISLEALYESDVDRDTKVFKLVDDHLGHSWYGVKAAYENSSDGFTHYLEFGKPFYSLESRRANGVSLYDNERIDSLYDHGEIAAQYQQQSRTDEIMFGWSAGLQDGWSKRYTAGFGFDEHVFSAAPDSLYESSFIPEDRKLAYPFFGMEWVQDKFRKTRNQDQIARVEDRFVGSAVSFKLGYASTGLGSDRDALLVSAAAYTTFDRSRNSSLVLSADFSGRQESDGLVNALLGFDARYYKRQSEKKLFYAQVSGTLGHDVDADLVPFLGGDNGLRGYPLRYQSGAKQALLTIEQRFYTDWYPFRLFPVGAAVFFDAGKSWGGNPLGVSNDGLLRDIGFGLRLGNPRSGHGNVLHMDIAYPLDGPADLKSVQFVVEAKQSF